MSSKRAGFLRSAARPLADVDDEGHFHPHKLERVWGEIARYERPSYWYESILGEINELREAAGMEAATEGEE